MTPTLYIALALVMVMVVRRRAPLAGSILGLSVAVALGVWGFLTYSRGGIMTVLGSRISPIVFYGFALLLAALEVLNFYLSLRRRQRNRAAQ